MLGTILLIVVVLLLLGSAPAWPHSRQWGYRPFGLFSILLIVLIVLMIAGALPLHWGA